MVIYFIYQKVHITRGETQMNCPNCNNPVEVDAKFCPHCGHNLEAAPAVEQVNEEVKATNKCVNCGNELEEGAKFCAVCGTPVAATAPVQPSPSPPPSPASGPAPLPPLAAAPVQVPQEPKEPFFKKLGDTTETTQEYEEEEINLFQRLSVVSYLGWLVLIPWICFPNSKYTRFHANQGLILAILGTALAIIVQILLILASMIHWILLILVYLIALAGSVVMLYLIISGIINAVKKRAKELPLVGKFRILK